MKTFYYAGNSWLLAPLVHPMNFMPVHSGIDPDLVGVLPVPGSIFYLPAYLLCLVVCKAVIQLKLPLPGKLALLIGASMVCIFAGFSLMSLVLLPDWLILRECQLFIQDCLPAILFPFLCAGNS